MKTTTRTYRGGVNWMDVIRIFAMTMVVILHLFHQISDGKDMVSHFIFEIFGRGVPVFFALSGYLIMMSLQRNNDLLTYYIKRLVRIIPAYYFVLLVLVLTKDMPVDETGLGWIRFFSFLNCVIPSGQYEWSTVAGFWCMPAFIWFYVMAPWVQKISKHFWLMLSFCILSYLFGKVISAVGEGFIFTDGIQSVFNCFPVFFYGCTAYSSEQNNKVYTFINISTVFLILTSSFGLSNYQMWGVAASIVIVSSNLIKVPDVVANSRWLRFCADVSFTVFLTHYSVIYLLNSFVANKTIYVILFVACTGIYTFILHYWIEKPVAHCSKKLISIYEGKKREY